MKGFARFFTVFSALAICMQGKSLATDLCCSSMPVFGEINIAYDDFRGIPDGTWNGNTGGVIGANLGVAVFDTFGLQAGGSYGVYDWYGRGPVGPGNSKNVQQQGFVTAGMSYQTPCCSGFQGGVVVDWMFNKNFGVFGLDPNFGQVRLQAGYLWDGSDEFGLWGTANLQTAHKDAYQIPVSFRAIGQVNLFWRHIFDNCAETMVWVGLPYQKSLMFSGKRAGQYILGGSFHVPLTSVLSVEAHGMYMGPSGNSSSQKFNTYDANVCIGLSYSFGFGVECCEEANRARPYLSIANNSNFLVDTNLSD